MTWIIKVLSYSACSGESNKVGMPVGVSCSSGMVGLCREQSRQRVSWVASKSGKPPNQCSREDEQAVPFSGLPGQSVLRDQRGAAFIWTLRNWCFAWDETRVLSPASPRLLMDCPQESHSSLNLLGTSAGEHTGSFSPPASPLCMKRWNENNVRCGGSVTGSPKHSWTWTSLQPWSLRRQLWVPCEVGVWGGRDQKKSQLTTATTQG